MLLGLHGKPHLWDFCAGRQQNCIDFLAGSFFSPEPSIRVEEYINELKKKNLKDARSVLQHLDGTFLDVGCNCF